MVKKQTKNLKKEKIIVWTTLYLVTVEMVKSRADSQYIFGIKSKYKMLTDLTWDVRDSEKSLEDS